MPHDLELFVNSDNEYRRVVTLENNIQRTIKFVFTENTVFLEMYDRMNDKMISARLTERTTYDRDFETIRAAFALVEQYMEERKPYD